MKKKVKRYKYLRGDFSGKYRGEMKDGFFSSGSSYTFDFYECSMGNCRVFETEEEVSVRSDKVIDRSMIRDVNIELVDELGHKSYYRDDLENVKVFNYTFTDVMKDGNETFGTIRGEVIAALGYIEEVEVVPDLNVTYTSKTSASTGKLPARTFSDGDAYAGCANALSAVMLGVFILALIALVKFRGLAVVLIIAAGLWLLLYYLARGPRTGKVLPRVLGWIFGGMLLWGIYYAVSSHRHHYYSHVAEGNILDQRYKKGNEENYVSEDAAHELKWSNYDYSKYYTGTLKIAANDFNTGRRKRESLDLMMVNEYEWQELYTQLYNTDRFHMSPVYRMFSEIGQKKHLNRRQFLEMIVTCVQHIRYSKVIETDCALDQDYTQKKYFSWEDTIGCLGYTKFGIQSPNEFAYNLLGDCDTRTVFLYTVLTHFNYDVLVFCSLEYAHSVLGINIPASGTYKTVNNKKYYLWETTYPDWTIGNVTPDMSDVFYWHVFLPPAKN